jgi:hypothetical protein
MGIGLVALLALLPLARDQLAATAGRSWMPVPTGADIRAFLLFPWGWRPAAALMLAGLAAWGVWRAPAVARRWPALPFQPLNAVEVALLASALVPIFILTVSLTYKPVLLLRYEAPAVLAVATLTALAVERLPAPVRWLAVLYLVRATLFSFGSAAETARIGHSALLAEGQAVARLHAAGIRTVSPLRHDAYQASVLADGAPSVAWVVLSDSLLARTVAAPRVGLTRDNLLTERDFGRAVQSAFGFPAVTTLEAVRSDSVVALMRDASYAAADTVWLPGRQGCPISPRLVAYVLPRAPISCEQLQSSVQPEGRR